MPDGKCQHSPEATLPRRRTCILIVTHQCNLNCRYCYESFKSQKAIRIRSGDWRFEVGVCDAR